MAIFPTVRSSRPFRHEEGQVGTLVCGLPSFEQAHHQEQVPNARIEYILERLDGAQYFTKIDLKNNYHQVRIFEADF